MKMKLIFAAAAASALLLSSCRKADEVTSTDAQFDELEFTATIDGPVTKTTVNTNGNDETNRGKIEWVAGDEITITDASKVSVIYVATNSGTTSTFRKKSGQSVRLGSGPYTATYGTAPSTSQNYADHYKDATHAQNVYMTAGSDTRSLTFKAACGLLKLTLTAATGESNPTIKQIEVTGTVNGTETTYTLNCVKEGGTAVSISSATDFYLTLPAGTYTKMVFTNDSDATAEYPKSGSPEMTIENNKIQPMTIDDVTFTKPEPVFSVSDSNKVQFTKGNLWWGKKGSDTTATWHLEESQTSYPASWNTNHVGLFFWTNLADYNSGNAAYMPYAATYSYSAQSINDTFFCGEDNPMTVDGQGGLYALTQDEWSYLFGTSTERKDKYKSEVTVNGVTDCLVIAPDNYSGTLLSEYSETTTPKWSEAEESGLVCLPAAGYRYGSVLSGGGSYGNYWSATPLGSSESIAYGLHFNGSNVGPAVGGDRYCGHSVRLVSTVSK